MKIALVKFSDAHERNTKWNQQTARETRGIQQKSRTRWVSFTPVFDWDRDDASTHDEGEAQQWNDGGDTVNKVSRERRNCQSSSVEMQCDVQSRV